jgi:hypothetical protein
LFAVSLADLKEGRKPLAATFNEAAGSKDVLTEITESISPVLERPEYSRLRASLEQVRPELVKMTKGELIALNIEVSKAAGLVLGALPKIRALRDVFEADLVQFDITLVDKLETYCLAVFQADVLYRITTRGHFNDW